MIDLGILGGNDSGGTYAEAIAISDNGQVIGVSGTPGGASVATVWTFVEAGRH